MIGRNEMIVICEGYTHSDGSKIKCSGNTVFYLPPPNDSMKDNVHARMLRKMAQHEGWDIRKNGKGLDRCKSCASRHAINESRKKGVHNEVRD